jgi:hypothetical protein
MALGVDIIGGPSPQKKHQGKGPHESESSNYLSTPLIWVFINRKGKQCADT